MDIWAVLEIECCRDKQVIRAAYHEKLTRTNPEDSPEAFMELRSAYEAALQYADTDTEVVAEVKDESPIGLFMQKAEAIYNCFSRRLSLAEWQTLLADDLCQALDTKLEVRDRLLTFFMEHYRLPQAVWQLLDHTFALRENKEALCELFPTDYIEHAVIGGVDEPLAIPLELFEGADDADYDQFVNLYFKSVREIDNRDLDVAVKTLEQMEQLGIYHPYMEIGQIRLLLNGEQEGRYEQAAKRARLLYEKYPDDIEVLLYMGETAYFLEQTEVAREYFERVLAIQPEYFVARYRLIGCLEREGKLAEAKVDGGKLMDDYPTSQAVMAMLIELNKKLMKLYQRRFEEDQTDVEAAEELAWCYLQNDQIDEGIALLTQYSPAHKDRFTHLNLCGRLYLAQGEYEKALTYFKEWEEQGAQLVDDGTEEVTKELGRRELPIYMQAVALMKMQRNEEALACLERSLAIKRDQEALYYKALLSYQQEDWPTAVALCDEMISNKPEDANGFVLRGKCYYEMGHYQESYEDFVTAIGIYPYQLDSHIYKGRILLYYDQYDEAWELVEYLEQEAVESDRIQVLKAEILAARDQDGDKEAARQIFMEVIRRYEVGESDIDRMHEVYYDLAVLLQHDASLDEIMSYIEKGRKIKPNDENLLDYQAYQFEEHKKIDAALKCHEQLLTINPRHFRANYNCACIWFDRQEYEKALDYLIRHLDIETSGYALELQARTYIKLGRMKEALISLEEAIKIDPEDGDHYYFAAMAQLYLNQCEEALKSCEQAIKTAESERRLQAAHMLKAQICARLERYQEAIASRYKCLELSKDGDELLEIMELYEKAGEYGKAVEILEQWQNNSKASDTSQRYLLERGKLYFLTGELKKGYKAIKKSKSEAFARQQYLFEYYWTTGALARAKKIARQLMDKEPELITGYLWLAMCAFDGRELALARELAAKVLDMLSEKGPSLTFETRNVTHMICCYAILGDAAKAQECIGRALGGLLCQHCHYGYCVDAYLAAGFYYESVQMYEQAMAEYEKGMAICKDDSDFILRTERVKKRLRK